MSSLLTIPRSQSALEMPAGAVMPSFGIGADSKSIYDRLTSIKKLLTGPVSNIARISDTKLDGASVPEQLRMKSASLKRIAAAVAMHFTQDWRQRLFTRLDEICNAEDWDADCVMPSEQSFSTFLRMIIYLHPTRRPGIGLSHRGHFLAAWTKGSDRIVIECVGNDDVRWVLSRLIDGKRESGAGKVSVHRIPDVIAGYDPEELFNDGHRLLA
jgi:hypothetical protein